MNLLAEIQKIPGILIFNQKIKNNKNVLTCHFNWVLKDENGLINLDKTLFKTLKWKKIGNEMESTFMFKNFPIPTTIQTKINYGYIVDDVKFSIPFDLELPVDSIPADLDLVKKIVSDFNLIKKEVNSSLKESAKPFS